MDFEDTIVLETEDGEEVEFEILDVIEYNNEEYVVMLPVDDDESEVTILLIEHDDDEDAFVSIEDDDVLMTVFQIFKDKFKDEFNFVD